VVHKANPSANECGICEDALHDWVGIECLEMNDGSGDEMTVCCDCWQSNKSTLKEEGWENQDGSDGEESEPDVDDYDAPNIFPYKKCSACGERCSCGSYTTDKQWLCEGCSDECACCQGTNAPDCKNDCSFFCVGCKSIFKKSLRAHYDDEGETCRNCKKE
jgi:hypothetical protein